MSRRFSENRAVLSVLAELERSRQMRGPEAAARKLVQLRTLERAVLERPAHVLRLHESLCFLRAYPDNARIAGAVTRMLLGFSRRADLRMHRHALADTGIAGTSIHYAFYYLTALWLARRWPKHLSIDWKRFTNTDPLHELLPLLLPEPDALVFDHGELSLRELIASLKGPDETDAVFLVRTFEAFDTNSEVRQKLFEDLEIPLTLTAGVDTPSRSTSKFSPAKVFHVPSAPGHDLEWRRMQPRAVRTLSPRQGARAVDLARVQMVTRGRDLYAFMHASPRGVRLFDMGEGLQFACIGLKPAQRFLIETLYVYVALQSGIPVGYVQATTFLRSAEINFNVFDTFRGAQGRHIFRAVLAMARRSLGCDTFIMNTQQLGEGNEEALKTGAWWFYYKFGFRPRNRDVETLMREELGRKATDPAHRSSRGVLKRLGGDCLYLSLATPRAETVTTLDTANIALAASRRFARHYGSDRKAAQEACVREAVAALELEREPSMGVDEREAWRRWAPLVLVLPGLAQWSTAQKHALAGIMRAKGGISEADYLQRVDAHPKLRRALCRLARSAARADQGGQN